MAAARKRAAIALTIAGSDSSGGAGIQADIKTFTVLGVYGASVITALTAQNTQGVQGVHSVPPEFIAKQIASVASDLAIGAVKTGMLGDRATVETVAAALRQHDLRPVVVDPVMVATSGDALLAPDAVDAVRRELFPLADIATPNLPEAARLLDEPVAMTESEMEAQGRRLVALGARAVLIKGGHGTGPEAVDFFVAEGVASRLAKPRLATRNIHGTGCTLSAAIAGLLARGEPLEAAVRLAKEFVWRAIAAGRDLEIGHGAGPVDHLHDIRGNNG
ncbi:MAG TPA: bifunctional hydroxymethylpyrimidine kinase/phosphomethylpyrimidine kinase [Hyphomicrobiaceae bacterium]|nr:bifunctional hydroxymethylpyrimidine kinase/phosphomethylpyrimidine kinase [Hyphomicrobiaceae bacterium]